MVNVYFPSFFSASYSVRIKYKYSGFSRKPRTPCIFVSKCFCMFRSKIKMPPIFKQVYTFSNTCSNSGRVMIWFSASNVEKTASYAAGNLKVRASPSMNSAEGTFFLAYCNILAEPSRPVTRYPFSQRTFANCPVPQQRSRILTPSGRVCPAIIFRNGKILLPKKPISRSYSQAKTL